MPFIYLPGQVTQRELARVVENLELNELKQSADRARAHKDHASLGVFSAELGRRYKNGVGVPADPRTSFTWFTESAGAGLMSSQFGVGCMYLDEGGRPFTGQGPDFENALHWIRLSAAQGFPDAVETLAGLRHHLRAEKVRRVFTSGIPLDRGRIVGDIPNAVAKDYGFPHCEIIPHDGTVTVVLSIDAGNGPRFMFTVEDGVLQAGADQQVVIVPDYPSRKWWELVRAQEKNDKASIDSHIDYFDALLDKLLAAPSHAPAAKMPGRPTQTRPVSEHDRAPPRPSPPSADRPRKRKRKRRPRVWSKSLVAPLLGAIAFGVVASSRTDFGISVLGLLDALHLLHRTDTTAFTGGKPRYVDNHQSYRSEALAFPSLGIATSVVFRQLPSSEWGTTWKVVPGSIGAGVLVDAYSARYHDVLLTCAPVGSKSSTSYQMQFLTVTSEPDEDTLLAIPGVVSSCAQRLVVGPGQTPQVVLRHPDATATIASYQGSSVYMEEQVDWGARQSAVCSQLLELLPDEIDRHQLCGFDLQSVARELSEEWRPNLAHWCFTYSDRLNDAHIPGWHYDPSSAMIDPLTEKARSAARRARRVQILSADFKAHVCQPAVAVGR